MIIDLKTVLILLKKSESSRYANGMYIDFAFNLVRRNHSTFSSDYISRTEFFQQSTVSKNLYRLIDFILSAKMFSLSSNVHNFLTLNCSFAVVLQKFFELAINKLETVRYSRHILLSLVLLRIRRS
jgi:hypothetical protein